MGKLEELQPRVTLVEPIAQFQGLSPFTMKAQHALAKAKRNFTQKEYSAVVRNLNFYLNNSQKPEANDYLISQYLLGSSYQYLGQTRKSIRAYRRYLASYLTSNSKTDLNFVSAIQNILLLSTEMNSLDKKQIRELISSLASIEMPKRESSRVAFYLAMTANHKNETYFAERLFKKSKDLSSDPVLQAENLYFSAIIPFQAKDYATSEIRFKEVLSTDSKNNKYHAYANLNIARIEAIRGNMESALSYYNRVSDELNAQEHALYESIFIHYKMRNYSQALLLSKKYVLEYKNKDRIEQSKQIIAYLETRTGNIKDARTSIEERTKAIRDFEAWLVENYSEKERVNLFDLISIQDMGRVVSPPSRSFGRAEKLFSRMNSTLERLSNIRSEIRSTIYYIGQLRPEAYNPHWKSRSAQIENNAQAIFDQGDQLLSIEFEAYKDQMNEDLKVKLLRSQKRRAQLKKKHDNFRYNQGRWQSWVTLTKLSIKLGNLHEKLQKSLAYTRSMEFSQRKTRHIDLLADMLGRGQNLLKSINRAVEIVKSRAVRDMANQSHNAKAYKYIIDYSQITYEEAMLYSAIRDQYRGPSERHMSQDLSLAWQKWEFLVKKTFSSNRKLAKEVRDHLTLALRNLDNSITSYDRQTNEILRHKNDLELSLGKNLARLLGHYNYAIKEKKSELVKWQADNQWSRYNIKTQIRQKEEKVFMRQEAKMEEDLYDLEYEVKR